MLNEQTRISSKELCFLGQLNACSVTSSHIRIRFFRFQSLSIKRGRRKQHVENELRRIAEKPNLTEPAQPRERRGGDQGSSASGPRRSRARDATGPRGAAPLLLLAEFRGRGAQRRPITAGVRRHVLRLAGDSGRFRAGWGCKESGAVVRIREAEG